jgi:hypothetical protein
MAKTARFIIFDEEISDEIWQCTHIKRKTLVNFDIYGEAFP